MDTFFASKKSGKSVRGYTCCQVFATEFGHVMPVLMQGKVELSRTISKNGKKTRRMTTQGWYFLIRWKDSTESWSR